MFARVSTIEGSPDKADDAIAYIKETVIPAAREMDGFKGAYFLMNRDAGKSIGVTFWASKEALEATEDKVKQLRSGAATITAGEVKSVEHFEVVAEA